MKCKELEDSYWDFILNFNGLNNKIRGGVLSLLKNLISSLYFLVWLMWLKLWRVFVFHSDFIAYYFGISQEYHPRILLWSLAIMVSVLSPLVISFIRLGFCLLLFKLCLFYKIITTKECVAMWKQ